MPSKVFIIHVGNMKNKGTQALLLSDVFLVRNTLGYDTTFSISTSDVEGVRKLLPQAHVFPTFVGIPYEVADLYALRRGIGRDSIKYKAVALIALLAMPLQVLLSVFSALFVKAGLPTVYNADLLKDLKDSDIIISCSDENFKDGVTLLPENVYWMLTWWTLLVSRMADVMIAKFLGKPIVMFPNSIGRFHTRVGKLLAKMALSKFDHILVRESKSCSVLDSLEINVPRTLTSDVTLIFDKDRNLGHQFRIEHHSQPAIGVCVGFYGYTLNRKATEHFVSSIAEALDDIVDKADFEVVFIPHYISGFPNDDLKVSKLVMNKMRNGRHSRICAFSSVHLFKTLISQMDIVLSSKMHPAVLSVASGVPVVCIGYDNKQFAFFDQLGLAQCVLPIKEVSKTNLESRIDDVWRTRKEIVIKLECIIPVLQKSVVDSTRKVLSRFVSVRSSKANG